MKYVFNALIVIVVIVVIRMAACKSVPNTDRQVAVSVENNADFDGARLIKTCKHYFLKPESVALDKDNDVIYVSNVVDSPTDRDSNGYVCKASLYGEIIDTLNLKANSPKGMAVSDGFLYVADIDKVLKYSIEDDSLVASYPADKSIFLNDVAVDNSGNVYISDSQADRIFRLSNDSITVFCADTLCAGADGICMDGKYLVVGARYGIIRIDDTGKVEKFVRMKFAPEGITPDGRGNYIVSDLNGGISAVSKDSSQTLVRKRNGINCADFIFILEQNLLIVPTLHDNSLEIYELGRYLVKEDDYE